MGYLAGARRRPYDWALAGRTLTWLPVWLTRPVTGQPTHALQRMEAMRTGQHHPARKRLAALGAAALLPLAVAASAGASSYSPTWKAVTALTIRPISGNHDNAAPGVNHTWADASFTRSASVTFYGQVAPSFCPGITHGECYYWIGESLDTKGHFTVNPTATSGAYAPGNGTGGTGAAGPFTIGTVAHGTMAGRYHYGFYATTDKARPSRVPKAEDDHGTTPLSSATSACTGGSSCGVTDCLWIEQFFPHGTQFWDLNGNLDPSCLGLYGSWYYYLPMGADEACSLVTSKWVTASWDNWGADPVDGNVFAPDASRC